MLPFWHVDIRCSKHPFLTNKKKCHNCLAPKMTNNSYPLSNKDKTQQHIKSVCPSVRLSVCTSRIKGHFISEQEIWQPSGIENARKKLIEKCQKSPKLWRKILLCTVLPKTSCNQQQSTAYHSEHSTKCDTINIIRLRRSR